MIKTAGTRATRRRVWGLEVLLTDLGLSDLLEIHSNTEATFITANISDPADRVRLERALQRLADRVAEEKSAEVSPEQLSLFETTSS